MLAAVAMDDGQWRYNWPRVASSLRLTSALDRNESVRRRVALHRRIGSVLRIAYQAIYSVYLVEEDRQSHEFAVDLLRHGLQEMHGSVIFLPRFRRDQLTQQRCRLVS